MPNASLAVYTTVFPNAIPFLPAFVDSLTDQSDDHFDLWIGLDRLRIRDVEHHFAKRLEVTHWVRAEADDTPASIRQRAWAKIVDRYDAAVFVDADDILASERVAAARRGLEDADVYACALEIIDEYGTSVGPVLVPARDIDWRRALLRWNVFGLSNTAYRCVSLERCLPLARETGLIDWHVVTRAMANGAELTFDRRPLMRYRQYAANTARILPPLSPDYVRKATEYVVHHFRTTDPYLAHDPELKKAAAARSDDVQLFGNIDHSALQNYVEYYNQTNRDCYLWWEYIAADHLRDLWASQ